jgi:hypothetical protein
MTWKALWRIVALLNTILKPELLISSIALFVQTDLKRIKIGLVQAET